MRSRRPQQGRGRLHLIDQPHRLRRMARKELPALAMELRQALVTLGAERGGHFAGSLGTVELTVALHYVFDTPQDRLIWDVGHQAHGHKALTGRLAELRRIKQADGPSGFLRRSESPFDVFGAGHAGTSVSAGLGIAEALRRRADDAHCVVVLGDGGATAGMAFEGLNHAGYLGSKLRVVLNDNGMSIAPSVGGMAKTGSVRSYFESLGLRYLGPVDGHDLDELVPALQALRDARGPTTLHVLTRKGRGFAPAEADPYRWHATTPFDPSTGERNSAAAAPPQGPRPWTAVFSETLSRLADRDRRVVAITAAMPDGTGLDAFARRHPDRVYDVGIAEQHAVTFAAGMAAEGFRPVCAIYSTFLQRALDQIVHDVALQGLPVVFALDRAGLVGGDGPTHHGVFDLAYLRMIPNLVVAAPRDENELQHLLATALDCDRPFAVRFPRGVGPGVPLDPDPKPLPIGRATVLREGQDVALVGIGKTVPAAAAAAQRLAERGIEVQVIDARFVKPLDRETLIESARRCGRIVTIEDHVAQGGFGSAVLELLSSEPAPPLVRVLGIGDRFVEHGDVQGQWREAGIDAVAIADGTYEWLTREA